MTTTQALGKLYKAITGNDARNSQAKIFSDLADNWSTATTATTSSKGMVKQAAKVAEAAGSAPTAAEFKALLDALKTAGIMKS